MPPILFVALSTFITGLFFLMYLFGTDQLRQLFDHRAHRYIAGNTLFNIIIPYILIAIGTSRTSGINTALIFAYLILHEAPTLYQWTGLVVTVAGLGVASRAKTRPIPVATS